MSFKICLLVVVIHQISVASQGIFEDCNSTQTETDCEILCNSAFECFNTTLSCLGENDCYIECRSDNSCQYSQINYDYNQNNLTNSYFGLNCERFQACFGNSIFCPKHGSFCFIDCDGNNGCETAQINSLNLSLTMTSSMYVLCNVYETCHNITIYCPQTSGTECNITCDGNRACRYSRINSKYALLPDVNDTNPARMNLICSLSQGCQDSVIYCLQFGICNIDCDASQGCRNSKIYCPQNQDCLIKCVGYACRESEIYCPTIDGKCSITCDGNSACRDMTVHCFEDNKLAIAENVNYNGTHANSSSYCNVTCQGAGSPCDGLVVNWTSSQTYRYIEIIGSDDDDYNNTQVNSTVIATVSQPTETDEYISTIPTYASKTTIIS